jgi:hypothetical protein
MLRHLIDTIIGKYNDIIEPMTLYNHRSKQYRRNPLIAIRFFTVWALIIHALHRIGLFPLNTFFLALFVLIGSIVLFWIFPGYYRYLYNLKEEDPSSPYYELSKYKYRYITILIFGDILTHYLPLFLLTTLPITTIGWLESGAVLCVSLLLYICIFGMEYVWNLYYYILHPTKSAFIDH